MNLSKRILLKPCMNPIQEVNADQLMDYVNGMYPVTEDTVKEFRMALDSSIKQAKETGVPQLINWAGHFDLLITDMRIHLILIHQTFYLPE